MLCLSGIDDSLFSHLEGSLKFLVQFLLKTVYFVPPGRNNHHDKDLNRDFLLFGKEGITDKFYDDFQPETKLLADLITSRQFVLSINFHGGSLVANYPYDYPYSQLPSNQHGAPASSLCIVL